jgi:isochorismate synthase EntC
MFSTGEKSVRKNHHIIHTITLLSLLLRLKPTAATSGDEKNSARHQFIINALTRTRGRYQ